MADLEMCEQPNVGRNFVGGGTEASEGGKHIYVHFAGVGLRRDWIGEWESGELCHAFV